MAAKRNSSIPDITDNNSAEGNDSAEGNESAERHVVIVGASLAGIRAAGALRRDGFDGTITMVGDEPHKPYDRPPLSKQYLAGEWELDRLALVAPDKLDELDLTWRLGAPAAGLDVDTRTVTLSDDSSVTGDAVIIATGARARTIPGTDQIGGVHLLRSLDDANAVRAALAAGPQRLVVVGAGFIGAEVAATARELGVDVTMIEMAEVPLQRGLGDQMGMVCADLHREHGVDLRLGVGVASIEAGPDGHVAQVVLSDGSTIDTDLVVVGIGVIPNTEWLDGSGLTIDNGVVCDETCQAAPGIYAAGDVARWPNRRFDELMRLEHWDNAVSQGTYLARRIFADPSEEIEPYMPVPWFWSDQYDRKIQLAGRVRSDDEIKIVTGTIEERRFAAIYGRNDKIVGVLAFNRPRHVMQYRQLIADGASWDEALAFGQE